MKNTLLTKLYGFSFILELLISVLLAIVLILFGFQIFIGIFQAGPITSSAALSIYIEEIMSLAIGVELIKMLCKHTPGTIIEVLLFAIARQIIISHDTMVTSLIGVICIAILFAVRKYLLVSNEDREE